MSPKQRRIRALEPRYPSWSDGRHGLTSKALHNCAAFHWLGEIARVRRLLPLMSDERREWSCNVFVPSCVRSIRFNSRIAAVVLP